MDRYCRECSVLLVPEVNWSPSLVKKPEYHCKFCRRNRHNAIYAAKYHRGAAVCEERIINDRFNVEMAGFARAKRLAALRRKIERQIAMLPTRQGTEDRVVQLKADG